MGAVAVPHRVQGIVFDTYGNGGSFTSCAGYRFRYLWERWQFHFVRWVSFSIPMEAVAVSLRAQGIVFDTCN